MAWFLLLLGGLCEVVWVVSARMSDGFSRWLPAGLTVVAMILSLYFVTQAVRWIPMGTAYAVWTGIGAVGTAALGMIFFGEPRDVPRLVCIGLILTGIIGLRVSGSAP